MLDYNPSDDADTSKGMAAMGVLSTIKTLIMSFHSSKSAVVQETCEAGILPVLLAIFTTTHCDFVEEGCEIMESCTQLSVSHHMWQGTLVFFIQTHQLHFHLGPLTTLASAGHAACLV